MNGDVWYLASQWLLWLKNSILLVNRDLVKPNLKLFLLLQRLTLPKRKISECWNDFQSLKTVKCKYWQHMFRIEKGFLVEIYVQKLKMKTFGTQFLELWYLTYIRFKPCLNECRFWCESFTCCCQFNLIIQFLSIHWIHLTFKMWADHFDKDQVKPFIFRN